MKKQPKLETKYQNVKKKDLNKYSRNFAALIEPIYLTHLTSYHNSKRKPLTKHQKIGTSSFCN
jgi:hypothetical protein